MKGYTIKESIDLLEKEIKKGGGGSGASSAADVSYNNTISGLTADDVQEALDELAARNAAGVSYNNTSSGLTADDVQEAVDELALRDVVSSTETLIGKWGNDDLYQSVVTINELPNAATTGANYPHGIANIDKIKSVSGVINLSGGNFATIPHVVAASNAIASQISIVANATNIVVAVGVDRSAASAEVVLKYTKAAPTRTRKSKKEE